MGGRIVIADADQASARAQRDDLEACGCLVETITRGDQVLALVGRRTPDVVLVSLSLPGTPDALSLCRTLQSDSMRVPVIVTASSEVREDRVRALRAGADDYMAMPWTRDEIQARVEARLRRAQPPVEAVQLGPTFIDFRRQLAIAGDRPVSLTSLEFGVLRCLAARKGGVVTRDELLQLVWGYSPTLLTRTVDNCVLRLRRKIEADPRRPTFLVKAYGDGYRLNVTQ